MALHTVLVINSGSSSIKYQLVDPDSGQALASGLVERIGEEMGAITHKHDEAKTVIEAPVPDHRAGLAKVLELFESEGPSLAEANIAAVGHRVVQGGRYFDGPALVNEAVENRVEALIPLGPLHNGPALAGIRVARQLLPDVPHVVVFDTAFFQGLPEASARYALNREVADKYEIRRYGAHGTSHQYVSSTVSQLLGRDDLKQIVLHLGNGASASAVVCGRAVDTSMGLTPLEGLVMGTRTGDIDPAAVFHLARVAGMDAQELDMREVWKRIDAGDTQAREAMDIYIHRLLKYVGSYTAVMGGLDALTFTAGIGENDAAIRAELCARLGWLGVELDEQANNQRSPEPRVVSTPDSKVKVLVVPTNEELAIARQAMTLV